MQGKAGYKPSPGYGDKMHLIGSAARPIWMGKKRDVPKLFSSEFWLLYEVWKRFNLGFGLPEAEPWTRQDQWIMDGIALFEEHYRGHFSPPRYLSDTMIAMLRARR